LRLQLFPKDFWVIDKELAALCSDLKFDKVAKHVSATVLTNMPHAYDFEIRAKIFQYQI